MPPDNESPPPLLGSWRNMYVLVIGTLASLCALFTLISWVYR